MTNPNNYPGAETTLVGWVAADAATPKYDKKNQVTEIRIPINEGYKKDGEFIQTGTTWYSYTAAGDAGENLKSIRKGDKVRIDNAKQEVREYETKDGEKRLGITLKFGTVTVLEAKNGGFVPEDEENPF